MKKTQTRLTALALSLALLLTSCGGGASATSMHLRKTEGTVGVSDGEGKELTPKENLGLYSGYQVGTQAESYAWIDLDKVKLTKMDAGSEAEIVKEGKKLEINMKSGSLFFNVTEPLADDESMNIRTATMAVGIRGTCGWVTQNAAALLEGTVSVTAGDQEVTITAGEMAVLTAEGTLEVKPLTAASVPAFVKAELEDNGTLAEAVEAASGLDVLAPVDPMRLRDMYTYSKMLNYNENGELEQEVEYFPDEQGRIGRNVDHVFDPTSGMEVAVMEAEYIYDEEGILQTMEQTRGGSLTVTENTADHRKLESVGGNIDNVFIYYYDEQGRETREETIRRGEFAWYMVPTYDAEGKLIRSDRYTADESPSGYILYEYD